MVSKDDGLVCSAVEVDGSGLSWCHALIHAVKDSETPYPMKLYLTENTISSQQTFELNELIRRLQIENIYIGLPDPGLTEYLADDPVVDRNDVARFPDFL